MLKNIRFVVFMCAMAIAMVLLLQFYWISSYYQVNQVTFEKEVNMAFEDALKKEFSLRCDTIQQLITQRLLDSTAFKITGEFDPQEKHYAYTIHNARDSNDLILSSTFNRSNDFNKPLVPTDTTFKKMIAERFAYTLRSEDLENHLIYYKPLSLGSFIDKSVHKYDFSTSRLKPVLDHYLRERKINVPYKFYLRETDSIFNRSKFKSQLLAKFPVITKSYPTYRQSGKQQFIRAAFTSPFSYILKRMGLMFACSLLLIGIVALSLVWIVRLLLKEKRLSVIKNDFISNITHEFKTPIASASAAIEALIDFDVLDDKEKTARYLNHAQNELKRLSNLVDKVLNISFYEQQQFEIKPESFDVDAIVKNILNNFTSAPVRPVNWTYSNQTPVTLLNADLLCFQHAISNIIDNSIKYADNEVCIEVNCTLKNNFFVISIKDNGIGMAPQDLALVFEKFYRVPTGNQHAVKGHGLGLNYVKGIIERHSGWYKIESEYGKGSVLSLGWPI